jgi:hypothetical protein
MLQCCPPGDMYPVAKWQSSLPSHIGALSLLACLYAACICEPRQASLNWSQIELKLEKWINMHHDVLPMSHCVAEVSARPVELGAVQAWAGLGRVLFLGQVGGLHVQHLINCAGPHPCGLCSLPSPQGQPRWHFGEMQANLDRVLALHVLLLTLNVRLCLFVLGCSILGPA